MFIVDREQYLGIRSPELINNDFAGKDIVSVDQFTNRREIETVFMVADEMQGVVERHVKLHNLNGHTVTLLFYQPSSRTFSSFYTAAQNLGADVVPMHGMTAYSSAIKGESLPDTIRTFQQTTAADLIVLRHPDNDSSIEAAHFSNVPIINAGSGRLAHPTQAVLDTYTIQKETGRIDDLTITMTGDLRNGRTIKSLSKIMAMVGENIKFNFIAPDVLKMPEDIVHELERRGAKVSEGSNGDLVNAVRSSDVLYVTRIQSEWFTFQAMEDLIADLGDKADEVNSETLKSLAEDLGQSEYEKAVAGYVIDSELLSSAPENMIVMHPLPRVAEIAAEVDDDPRAVYFKQMRYGLYSRMALMGLVTDKI